MAAFERADTYAKVAAIIAEKLNIDKDDVKELATLEDLGADSLDLVEIIMKLEEDFGIEIKDADAETLVNVTQVVDYVHALRTK
ncbi:acyl carrier protein [Candidatus Dependentiae bacterium HGW-Dependentiae-1]|nr:MAG: acyl carrier protein [Candidatus Dependentiae bacterium HGW-Dependentiae-1]